MTKSKKVTIPNWTLFGVRSVGVEIHTFESDDADVYQAALTVFIDDGVEHTEESDDQKVITLFLDTNSDDLDQYIFETVNWIAAAITNVGNNVFVFNPDGDIVKEIELDKFMPKHADKLNKKGRSNATFH